MVQFELQNEYVEWHNIIIDIRLEDLKLYIIICKLLVLDKNNWSITVIKKNWKKQLCKNIDMNV